MASHVHGCRQLEHTHKTDANLLQTRNATKHSNPCSERRSKQSGKAAPASVTVNPAVFVMRGDYAVLCAAPRAEPATLFGCIFRPQITQHALQYSFAPWQQKGALCMVSSKAQLCTMASSRARASCWVRCCLRQKYVRARPMQLKYVRVCSPVTLSAAETASGRLFKRACSTLHNHTQHGMQPWFISQVPAASNQCSTEVHAASGASQTHHYVYGVGSKNAEQHA